MNNPDHLTISRKWLQEQIDACHHNEYTAHARSTLSAYQQVLKQEINTPPPILKTYSNKIKSLNNQAEIIERVITTVCDHFSITRDDLLTRRLGDRKPHLILPKHISYWLLRQLTPMTFEAIGDIFGFDHSNVLASVKKIKGFVDMGKDEISKTAVKLLEQLEA